MKLPEIVGIAGTNGAGKDTLAEFLEAHSDYKNSSTSDILRVRLDQQSLPHTRENMRELGTRLREDLGNGALGLLLIEKYRKEKTSAGYKGLLITSMRHPAIQEVIKHEGGMVIWVDADRRTRYDRIRAATRDRVDDMVTYEEFCAQEDAEMNPPKDNASAPNMEAVRLASDMVIENNFVSRDAFEQYLKGAFELNNS
ncbi:MAG TPA: AAA family ATPase [Candidatus Saccharimonadales bacterium]|nr:AAA family ATPase [Candidatus Saccharimonadales bacterium]